jgi:hypothetical protein
MIGGNYVPVGIGKGQVRLCPKIRLLCKGSGIEGLREWRSRGDRRRHRGERIEVLLLKVGGRIRPRQRVRLLEA